jgi:D-aminopeptidase
VLQIDGLQVGRELGQFYLSDQLDRGDADGSVMIIIATDAPLSDRNLTRVARRALAGLARTGAAVSDGSGDYAIALSVADSVRRTPARRGGIAHIEDLANALLSPLFLAAIEATEEAIYNALSMATSMTGMQGRVVDALPHDQIAALHDRMTGTN